MQKGIPGRITRVQVTFYMKRDHIFNKESLYKISIENGTKKQRNIEGMIYIFDTGPGSCFNRTTP